MEAEAEGTDHPQAPILKQLLFSFNSSTIIESGPRMQVSFKGELVEVINPILLTHCFSSANALQCHLLPKSLNIGYRLGKKILRLRRFARENKQRLEELSPTENSSAAEPQPLAVN